MKKKKPAITKLLTGESIKGLNTKKPMSRYEEGALFSQVEEQMKKRMPLHFKGGVAQYPNGGTSDGDPVDPSQPVEVYEGSPNYNEYLNWESQNKTYNIYNTANTEATKTYGQGQTLSPEQFKSVPGFSDFELPAGATGVASYPLNGVQYQPDPNLEGNFYTTTDNSRVFIPVYGDPGQDQYKVVESPEEQQRKAAEAKYTEENKGIQGWVRQTYYDPESGTNKTELVPLPNGQPVPTDGTFVPKETFGTGTTTGQPAQYPDGGLFGGRFRKNKEERNTTPTANPTADVGLDDGTIEGSVVPENLVGKNYHVKLATPLEGEEDNYYRTLGDVLRNTFKKDRPPSVTYVFDEGGEKGKNITELLAGEKITELTGTDKVMPNAEVEDGEYIKFPDNTVQRAEGEKHKDGGIDLNIPDGTKILSNKRTLTKKEAEALSKEHDKIGRAHV